MSSDVESVRNGEFAQANQAKASFDSVYDATNPAAYLKELTPLDYRIPDEAAQPLRQLADEIRKARGADTAELLDVGCSYGINAAVLKYRTSFRAMNERYLGRPSDGEDAAEVDREFFAQLPADPRLRVIGLDVATSAVDYGSRAGLLDDAIVANLEDHSLERSDRERLAAVDLIVSTGCVGYVTEKTFCKLVDAISEQNRPPVVASFVLRMYPYDAIASGLARRGYTTQRLSGTFRQRRFKHDTERTEVLSALERLGVDPAAAEGRDGYLHAELFVSRPGR